MRRIDSAIIIPARNEERRIGTCLRSLAPQLGCDTLVVVVANNCTDQTEAAARAALPGPGLLVANLELRADQGVGTARRMGCEMAIRAAPALRSLLTTDADCVVAPDWVARNRQHLNAFDAVCGAVDPMPEERDILRHIPAQDGWKEATYRALVLRFYDAIHPEPHNPLPHHGETPGASLAFGLGAYCAVGGFSDRRTGEDRDLVRRMRHNGMKVGHVADVRVAASCRLTGRAEGGMAQTIKGRLSNPDFRIDDTLPPVRWLLEHAARGTLPVWPPELPPEQCLRPSDLPAQIARLGHVLDHFGQPGTGAEPAQLPATAPAAQGGAMGMRERRLT
ncbi:glycosyltransferase [Pseudosulfitobacter koreensis]|uniref:Glycosyltransferase family 2 protein n=1 Tax=Pseudosulfitobacter koreensis TaxID=2968472 RepID=A0ABT1Z0S2_9RHOB|nr:glycosyltransferase family A protein [Pseudosulfitobacter koreense]MCR8826686.1 glycosyltransferase family 2 protein [Pseudosulfitobacter koreense]